LWSRCSIAGVGDVNDDGYADFVVGEVTDTTKGMLAGRVDVYFGGASLDATPDVVMYGRPNELFGWAVCGPGDLNGDGFPDIAVGTLDRNLENNVYAYFGGPTFDALPDLVIKRIPGAGFYGWMLAGAGDVDGDGRQDLIACQSSHAEVLGVYPDEMIELYGGELWVVGERQEVRWRGHDLADLYVSLDGGATYELLASAVGGLEENAIMVNAPPNPTRAARVRLTYAGQSPGLST